MIGKYSKALQASNCWHNVNGEGCLKEREQCEVKNVSEPVFLQNNIPEQNIKITQGVMLTVELEHREDSKCLPKTWPPYLSVEVEPLGTVV